MAPIIGAGIGAAGGILGGLISSKKTSKAIKQLAATMENIAESGAIERKALTERGAAEQELALEQMRASETAQLGLFGLLGVPGTYEEAIGYQTGLGFEGAEAGIGAISPAGLEGLYRDVTKAGQVTKADIGGKRSKRIEDWEVAGKVLDPEAFVKLASQSSSFRTVSKMVAEVNQLMNREGPLWHGLNQSVIGSIYESSAAMQRQTMEEISREMAKGGSARRQGLALAQRFQAQEAINRQRTQAVWQAKLGLETWMRDYAQQTMTFAQGWVANHAGIRDQYTTAMSKLRTFWTGAVMPAALQSSAQMTSQMLDVAGQIGGMQIEMAQKQGNFISDIIGGISNLVGGIFKIPGAGTSSSGPSPINIAGQIGTGVKT